jgi:hypothetical protein
LPLGDALRPPRTITRRGAVPKLARRKRNATPRLASGDRGARRVRGDSRGTSAFCPLRTRACKRSTAHHTRSQAFTGLDARVLCSARAENHRRPVWEEGESSTRPGKNSSLKINVRSSPVERDRSTLSNARVSPSVSVNEA